MTGIPRHIAIGGIHTGIGKTVVSAVVAEALGADYWKPVQAGIEERDADTVRQLLTDGADRVHPEAVVLAMPASPHAAAKSEGVVIDYTRFQWPVTDKTLLIETAGGMQSPMTDDRTMADFVTHFDLPLLLVVQNYLGSINHTLLTLEVLKARRIKLIGMVVSGAANTASETFITQYSGVPVLARVPHMDVLDAASVRACAAAIADDLRRAFL